MGIIGRGSIMIGLVQATGLVQEFVPDPLVQVESSSAFAEVPKVFSPPRSRRDSKAMMERDFMMGVKLPNKYVLPAKCQCINR